MMNQFQLFPINRDGHTMHVVHDALWFETVFAALDQLHNDVCTEPLNTVSTLAPADMIGWLEDIIYTAQETVNEIRVNYPKTNLTDAELLSQKAR
ncbi:MAG: hypothetical protein JW966_01030 [Anaerolineae bacterium]|nr:hypothetical protein [Anaerolineae bacterium]